jgi:hypothetical protein
VIRGIRDDLPFGPAVVEALIDSGEHANAHEPCIRRAMAASLARLVELARPFTHVPGLGENMMAVAEDQLWPVPHDGRFDFEGTADGAEWIDRIASQARRARLERGSHCGRAHRLARAEHALRRWSSDSGIRLGQLERDARTADGGLRCPRLHDQLGGGRLATVPSAPEAFAFIADYEEGRGAAFSSEEQAVARAALVYTMAYTARCEHSDALTDMGTSAPRGAVGPPAPAGTARAFLAENASDLLGAAVGDVPAVG